MYIGPWQEYKLGQKQQKDREQLVQSKAQNEILRAELQRALEVRHLKKLIVYLKFLPGFP
jgi:hypothetical protein